MARGRPRSTETRDMESRSANEREVPKSAHQSRFYIPPHVIPKGTTYGWVAVTYDNAGTPNQDNWYNKFRNGWRPVPRDRHPELFPAVPNIGFGEDNDAMIKQGGQILCERPTADVVRDRKANEAKSLAQMKGVNWTQGADQNPFMPRFDQSSPIEFAHSAEFKE